MKLGLYKHYKGDLYFVEKIAINSKNGEEGKEIVVYFSCEKQQWHTRPVSEFTEEIMHNGNKISRFTFVKNLDSI